MDTPLIRIMAPGSYTSVEGVEVEFTEADLEAAAAAYDAAKDPAPIVIGHPKLDAPAYGWIESLSYEDGHLVARPDPARLDPAFAEAVRAGRYAKVSGKFYQRGSRSSPKPEGLYLKHVGFLGGAAPAVKGLGTVSFAEDDADAVTIVTTPQEKHMSDKEQDASFAEAQAALDTRQAEIDQREAAVAEREAKAAADAKQMRHDANVAFAEALVETGKLAPAGKALVIGVMDDLEAIATVSFGEAGGDITPLAAFKKLFDGARPVVSFGELAPADPDAEEPATDSQAIADEAVAFAEAEKQAGRTITIAAAVRHVTSKKGG